MRTMIAVLLASVLLAALLVACSRPDAAATPQYILTPAPTPSPTPSPSSSPVPSGPFGVRTILEASCVLGVLGAEIHVDYTAIAEGNGQITRVRLFVNDRLHEDSGYITQQRFSRSTRVPVLAGRRYWVDVLVDAGDRRAPAHGSMVRCPEPLPDLRA